MRILALVVLGGCSFHPHEQGAGDAVVIPDQIVITGDGMVACATWNARHFDPCALPPPPGDVHLAVSGSPYVYDTTNGGGTLTDQSGATITITASDYTQSGSVHAALWTVTGLAIDTGVTIDVIGSKPLIVAAWNSIDVGGTIDAGSHVGGRTGAGSNPASCASRAPGAGVDGLSGTGGGGGGGFAGHGAAGGTGDANGANTAGGGPGGTIAAPSIVCGGCTGGASGKSNTDYAAGGPGGGAILLAARISVTGAGSVLAGGAGGYSDISTTASYGGGGGGAGGFVGLEATTIDVSNATLAANGGGGGGGAVIAATATPGTDGQPSGTAAPGGGGTAGEVGGPGSSMSQLDGGAVTGTIPNGGGGGGGGGAGYVLHWALSVTTTGATISPPIQAGP